MLQSRFGLRAEVADAIAVEKFVSGSVEGSAGVGVNFGVARGGGSVNGSVGAARRWTDSDVAAISRDESRIQDAMESWSNNRGWTQNRDTFQRSTSTSSRSDVASRAEGISASVTDAQSFSREARRFYEQADRSEKRWPIRDDHGVSGSLNTSDAFLAFARAAITNTPLVYGHFDPADAQDWQSSDPEIATERSLLLSKYVERVGSEMRAEIKQHLGQPDATGLSAPRAPTESAVRAGAIHVGGPTGLESAPGRTLVQEARAIRDEAIEKQRRGGALIEQRRAARDRELKRASGDLTSDNAASVRD